MGAEIKEEYVVQLYRNTLSSFYRKSEILNFIRRFDFAVSNRDHKIPKSMAEFKAQLGEQLRAGKSSSTKSMYLQIMPSALRANSHEPEQVVGSTIASTCYVCGRPGHQSHMCRAIPQEDRDSILKILTRCQKQYEASRNDS